MWHTWKGRILLVLALIAGVLLVLEFQSLSQVTSTLIQRVRLTDGTREISTLFDADSGPGTQWLEGTQLRKSAAGGSVESGTTTDPLGVSPIQGTNLSNSSTTGGANTAVTVTVTGVAATRAHLFAASAYCSAGSATLTIQDGATTIWASPAGLIGTVLTSVTWPVGLSAATAANLVVTLGACGVGNTGTLNVQAARF